LTGYDIKLKALNPEESYFNKQRRVKDLYKGLTILKLKEANLDSVSTLYHYIQTYDRYKHAHPSLEKVSKDESEAQNLAACFLAYKYDQLNLPPSYSEDE